MKALIDVVRILSVSSLDLPRAVNNLLKGLLVSRIAYYGIVPFFPLLLTLEWHQTATQVGFIMSIAGLCGVAASLLGGPAIDISGVSRVMSIGSVVALAASAFLALDRFDAMVLSVAFLHIGKSVTDTAIKVHLSDLQLPPDRYEEALQLRYLADNWGALLGPMLFAAVGSGYLRVLSGLAFICFLTNWVGVRASIRANETAPHHRSQIVISPLACLHALLSDRRLSLCIGYASCINYIFAQVMVILSQYFAIIYPEKAVSLTALVVTINTILVVGLHPLYLKLRGNAPITHQMRLGFFFLMTSQVILAVGLSSGVPVLAVVVPAVALFTLADIVLTPLFTAFVNNIAPRDLRGTYFGLSTLNGIGLAVGALAGGVLLEYAGITVVFVVSSAVTVFAFILNHQLSNKLIVQVES